ncbi:MAG TPA: mannose-1-phosphate guanylyltransferase [Pirellulales bacterium]|jgi:mannose-1-phosphate guanylyltransferase|nr:mannose-1-phosphate guanylyltransferase [Pirellulales bacterium]
MLHAVIMAGGSGTRFWPESRGARPKQLLRLVGERSMIQATVDRLGAVVPPERILVVTNAQLVDDVWNQLPMLESRAIIGEPCRRDTAPCIGLAALEIVRDDPDGTMVVLPADHVISPDDAFRNAIAAAAELVADSPARIVTFGIRPTYPAESFGYIERGKPLDPPADFPAYQVSQFREKPKAEVARKYLAAGTFYWNSGIFVWKAATILKALEQHQPKMLAHLTAIAAAVDSPRYEEVFKREFTAIQGVSIDYAVMEHARDVVMIEAPFAWDDVGSWQAIARLQGTDAEGNTIAAQHLGLRTSGTIVRGPDNHLIVTLGLSDCIVVHTPDATLVANKHDEESIRQLVQMIAERGWQQYL